jgi:TRAP-type C4-dicarboxylate transport system permease small subunit
MHRIHRAVTLASTALNALCEVVLVLCGGGMALVIGVQVFFRYALNDSLFWSEELGRVLLVWLTFCGASVAYRRGAHIGVDTLVERLGARGRRVAGIAAQAVALVFFLGMVHGSWRLMPLLGFQTMPALGLGKQIPFAVVPASFAVLAVHALALMLDELAGRRA